MFLRLYVPFRVLFIQGFYKGRKKSVSVHGALGCPSLKLENDALRGRSETARLQGLESLER